MTIETLVVTMNQRDYSLVKKMNIQTDSIIGNQSTVNRIECINYKNRQIKSLTFNEVGVGLNRNNILMRATADICVLADDDMIFYDGYAENIKRIFDSSPDADVIIFSLKRKDSERYETKNVKRIGMHNFMRYGAAGLAFRRESITKNGIFFNLHFGGGAEYSAGEDTLFLHSCLKKKLKIIKVPTIIGELTEERQSTWFRGYTEKFFYDKGVVYAHISKKWSKLLSLQYCIRHRKTYVDQIPFNLALKNMIKGTEEL